VGTVQKTGRAPEGDESGREGPSTLDGVDGVGLPATEPLLPRPPGRAPSPPSTLAPRQAASHAEGATPRGSAEASTIRRPGEGRPSAPDGPTLFPVPGWDRYQGVRLLGEGGMGRVYLAYDGRLRRNVALKFLRSDSPDLTRRLVAEARAQARVEHPGVCKVYEVGEVEGRVYIAMQYVDGRPLNALAGEVGIEQKVLFLRDAAEGVHAAHRAGFIHRDLKPSNILVEGAQAGAFKVYVMDFGLARDWSGDGLGTATDAVIGTPHYMPPEQARGGSSRLDRRADVYALGATLYSLLTGRPPVVGANTLEVLDRIGRVEPPPPRALDPDIPVDLEAIVLKCLEHDRAARYGSARELADDLDRFLRGEPVLARPAGVLRRAWKRVRRHQLLFSVAVASALLVALAFGQAYLARRGAAEREALARRFAGRVEHIKARARFSGLSPLHDVRADRRALREEMRALGDEVRRAGGAAEGPGYAALGQAHLALDEDDLAFARLDAAWQRGYREPDVAYALALIMGRRYQRERLEAERLSSAEVREAGLREAERRSRGPALDYLRQSEGADLPSAAYVRALLAFYEGRYDDALAEVGAAAGAAPWFYEAPMLEGDILQARALRAWNRGERAPALDDLDAGRRAYARAAAVAESVPAVYDAAADLEDTALLIELYGSDGVPPVATRGLEAVARARLADPDDPSARLLEARLSRRLVQHRMRRGGGDVEADMARALAAARGAVDLAPGWAEAWLELVSCLQQWAWLRQERGLDPSAQLREAVAAFERLPPSRHGYEALTELGLVFKVWADYEDEHGLDSLEHRTRAIDAYEAAIALNERAFEPWANLGIARLVRASLPRADDPDGELGRARAALDRARALNPSSVVPYYYGGRVFRLEAQNRRDRGLDPRPALREALALYEQGLAISPDLPNLHNEVGSAHLDAALAARDAGESPLPHFERAERAFERALAVAPEQGFADNNLGEVYAERAAHLKAEGQDPTPSLRRAEAAYRKALAKLPGQAVIGSNLAHALNLAASADLARGLDPSPRLAQADEALRRAIAQNPAYAKAWAHLGEAKKLAALWRARRGAASDADFEAAAALYDRALAHAPAALEHRLAYADLCLEWGVFRARAGADPRDALQRGLALADAVLAARPTWADAGRLRARLLAASAGTAGPR
jgi:eukaryotic-like serine/threonine-protein kinase